MLVHSAAQKLKIFPTSYLNYFILLKNLYDTTLAQHKLLFLD